MKRTSLVRALMSANDPKRTRLGTVTTMWSPSNSIWLDCVNSALPARLDQKARRPETNGLDAEAPRRGMGAGLGRLVRGTSHTCEHGGLTHPGIYIRRNLLVLRRRAACLFVMRHYEHGGVLGASEFRSLWGVKLLARGMTLQRPKEM